MLNLDDQLAAALLTIDELEKSVDYYLRLAGQASNEAAEQRNRRMAMEEELAAYQPAQGVPKILYLERPPATRLPPTEVVKRIYTDRTVKIIEWEERPAGFFGRIGDRLDNIIRGY